MSETTGPEFQQSTDTPTAPPNIDDDSIKDPRAMAQHSCSFQGNS
jgi:hypothetical protein